MILQEAQFDEIYMDLRVDGNHANEQKGEEPIKYQNSNKITEELGKVLSLHG